MLGWCYWNIFMCLTSIPIYMGHWKSFMKFRIKKSHEMISYILIGMTLLSAWIALLSEWKCRSSTKPCNLAQRTLIELYNKSHEGFMLSWDQENASISLKLKFKLYRDATLTDVDQLLTVLAWSYTLNKSWSLSWIEPNLFDAQELIQCLARSNGAHKNQQTAVFGLRKFG